MFGNLRVSACRQYLAALPEGWTTIFLADLTGMYGQYSFCAVICPDELLPREGLFYSEIIGAKIVFFKAGFIEPTIVVDVGDGYKVSKGGFFVSFGSIHFQGTIHCYDGSHMIDTHPIEDSRIILCL
ncbi:MAG: hypothetical protein ACD_81C00163G0003 [uncultured bacterium]|uniref:Uncharacterized protein n=2 Tax=Candidatus Wolfeibacteriota TaxID=1752735 RepID=A0A0G1H931_9BACT|nr:MAG: hypothetical protein ACD_81C00163G0003 [uncultured bacterium]KKR12392.1 MAG: hypothetical protein UT41_C0002G0166 [Candidatus Wolfebacteria bacterium GW2011_GWC2_39_22]KKT43300.1 MAG: hypothetical protein UW32_C0002G0161 [Candidatus Wolfebacteria bacterium GW2011_GWE2_44_13]HBI26019.1 hypothetical protein [Candidatus Wolfebacteria bacterium]